MQKQNGSILIMLIVFIVLTASVGSALFSFNSTSSYSVTELNSFNNASQIVLSIKSRPDLFAKNIEHTLTDGNKFIIASNDTVTGIAYPESQFESRRTLDAEPPCGGCIFDCDFQLNTPEGNEDYVLDVSTNNSFNKEIANTADYTFAVRAKEFNPDGDLVGFKTDGDNNVIVENNKNMIMGAGDPDFTTAARSSFGNLWYSGSGDKNQNGDATGEFITTHTKVEDGKIDFNEGFRIFFMVRFLRTVGDGFTFTIMNGKNNSVDSAGGFRGEGSLLGYAGNSFYGNNVDYGYVDKGSPENRGLLPPKFAVEIDLSRSYPTPCRVTQEARPERPATPTSSYRHAYWTPSQERIRNNCDVYPGNRCQYDPVGPLLNNNPSYENMHVAYVFWGRNKQFLMYPDGTNNWMTRSNFYNYINRGFVEENIKTFDDNAHSLNKYPPADDPPELPIPLPENNPAQEPKPELTQEVCPCQINPVDGASDVYLCPSNLANTDLDRRLYEEVGLNHVEDLLFKNFRRSRIESSSNRLYDYWYCFRIDVDFINESKIKIQTWVSTEDIRVKPEGSTYNTTYDYNKWNELITAAGLTDLANPYSGTLNGELGIETIVREITLGEGNEDNPLTYRTDEYFKQFLFGWTSAGGWNNSIFETANFGIRFIPPTP